MDKQEIISELKNIVEGYLSTKDLDLVDLIYRYEGRDLVVRILADRPEGGISLGECAKLNSEISRILDEKDILQQGYLLEVSSPGLDRPLSSKKDFLRCLGKKVKIFLREPLNGKFELQGLINNADDDSVTIDYEARAVKVALNMISKAKQIV